MEYAIHFEMQWILKYLLHFSCSFIIAKVMESNMTNTLKIFWLASIKVSYFVSSPLISVSIETCQKITVANIHLLISFTGLRIKHSKGQGKKTQNVSEVSITPGLGFLGYLPSSATGHYRSTTEKMVVSIVCRCCRQ